MPKEAAMTGLQSVCMSSKLDTRFRHKSLGISNEKKTFLFTSLKLLRGLPSNTLSRMLINTPPGQTNMSSSLPMYCNDAL